MNSEKKRNQKKSETLTLEQIPIPNRFNPSTKRELEKKTKERRRTVQTLIPITGSDKRKENQIGEGERGNGPTSPCIGMTLRRRGRRRAEPGAAACQARPRWRHGQVARRRRAHPLGSTRACEGAGDGSMAASLHRLRSLLVAAGCAEEEGSSEEREREGSE